MSVSKKKITVFNSFWVNYFFKGMQPYKMYYAWVQASAQMNSIFKVSKIKSFYSFVLCVVNERM